VIVTPELVHPLPKGSALPDLQFPETFMDSKNSPAEVTTPGVATTGPAQPVTAKPIPAEQLIESLRQQTVLDLNKGGIKPQVSTGTQQPGASELPAVQVTNPSAPTPAPPQ
jgi:hypothetical protein